MRPRQSDVARSTLPLGAEFWSDWYPDLKSDQPVERRMLLRVVGHAPALDEWMQPAWFAQLRTVRIQERPRRAIA